MELIKNSEPIEQTQAAQLPSSDSKTIDSVTTFEDFHLPSQAYKFAVHLIKQKRYGESEKILTQLLKSENGFEVLEALSISLYHLGQWSRCAHVSRQALMLGEGFRDQRFQLLKFLGNSLIRLGDFAGAREAYEKAFLLYPGSDALQVNFGTLAIQENDWHQAIECFRQALFLNPDNDCAWVGLGLCHRTYGDLELAFANVERALDQNKTNETALSLLLDWCRDQNDFRRVIPRFMAFTDAGGFSSPLSGVFIQKAHQYGADQLADFEEFHMQLRTDIGNA